ncbi:MAG: MBOAT family protein [Solobacterium sp.]|nr:MBOAT family protein [Solobacterium sp.]
MSVMSLEYLGLAGFACLLLIFADKVKRKYTVLLCNLVFLVFLRANVRDWLYVVLLSIYVFAAGRVLSRARTKALTISACVLPVLGLLFFKYAGYFLSGRILMPLGLSFYTFKAISYLADTGTGKLKSRDLISVFDYLVFFPAFMAGPIHRPKEFFAELRSSTPAEYDDRRMGVNQAGLGFAEKMLIADELGSLVPKLYSGTGAYLLLGIIVYAFQIYTDFDSYSNIAIGTARMMGFHLKPNFRMPYLSATLKEFWSKWHISLSEWLRDYVYIPLGGSRKGALRKYLNIIVVFLVSGIWHGSTMMFVIWGLGHGIIRCLEDLILGRREIPKALRPLFIVLNFIIVSILWVFFRSSSVSEALGILSSARILPFVDGSELGITRNEWVWMFVLIIAVIVLDLLRSRRDMLEWLGSRPLPLRWAMYTAVMILVIIFGYYGPGYDPADFIYVTF